MSQIEPTEELRVLNLFKVINGARVPYKITIDKNQVIVREGFENNTNPKVTADDILNERIKDLTARGISFVVEGHRIIIKSIPPRERLINSFYTPLSPCPYPQCDELREKFLSEKKALEESQCTDCDLSKLMNKYRELIEPLIP